MADFHCYMRSGLLPILQHSRSVTTGNVFSACLVAGQRIFW